MVFLSSIVGFLLTFVPKYFYLPFEQIFLPLLVVGGILLFGEILFIYFIEKREGENLSLKKFNWKAYNLDKYDIIKGIVFGSVIFLNVLFQWNIIAFYSKFLFMISPHTIYFIFTASAIVLFFGGIQLFIKIFKYKVLNVNSKISNCSNKKRKYLNLMIVELLGVLIGLLVITIVSFMVFFVILNTTLFGNLTLRLLLFLSFLFLAGQFIKRILADKSLFGTSIFVPLIIFTIFAFLFHI